MLYRSILVAALGTVVLGIYTPAQVVINEVCADNVSTLSPGGTHPDYIEIYNAGTAAVSLSGWTLTDDLTVKTKYAFPGTTSIGAKGRRAGVIDFNVIRVGAAG